MTAHGRSGEIEADEHGARYAAAAGHNPQAMAAFFQTLMSLGGSAGGPAFLRSHPTSTRRINNLGDDIGRRRQGTGETSTESHRPVVSRLDERQGPAFLRLTGPRVQVGA